MVRRVLPEPGAWCVNPNVCRVGCGPMVVHCQLLRPCDLQHLLRVVALVCCPMSVFSRPVVSHLLCVRVVSIAVMLVFVAFCLSTVYVWSMFVGRWYVCFPVSFLFASTCVLYQFSSVCLIFSVCVTLFSQCSSFRITISVSSSVCPCVFVRLSHHLCVYLCA